MGLFTKKDHLRQAAVQPQLQRHNSASAETAEGNDRRARASNMPPAASPAKPALPPVAKPPLPHRQSNKARSRL